MRLAEERLPCKGNTCLDLKISSAGLWGSSLCWATITQQSRTRWSCLLCAPTRHVGNSPPPLAQTPALAAHGCSEEQTLGPLRSSPEAPHRPVRSRCSRSSDRLRGTINFWDVELFSLPMPGKERGKREQGSAAPLPPSSSRSWVTWEEPCLLLMPAQSTDVNYQ